MLNEPKSGLYRKINGKHYVLKYGKNLKNFLGQFIKHILVISEECQVLKGLGIRFDP